MANKKTNDVSNETPKKVGVKKMKLQQENIITRKFKKRVKINRVIK